MGVGVSRGIAIGRAYVVRERQFKIPKREIREHEVAHEVQRLKQAVAQALHQLERVRAELPEDQQDTEQILRAHQLILEDELLLQGAIHRIEEERINAEWALLKTIEQIRQLFLNLRDEFFREREADVRHIGERLLRSLAGEGELVLNAPPDAVVVARELGPADVVQLGKAAVAGFVTESGGMTSHTALVARAVEVPAVMGIENIWSIAQDGDLIALDGYDGTVVLHPTPETTSAYRAKARRLAAREREFLQDRQLPAETTDGVRVQLLANIELAEEVQVALEHGAEGIGLYRTEYFYLRRNDLPSEAELVEDMRNVLQTMGNLPVTFRTFDLGGDKAAQLFGLHEEPNPALGLRSTRLALHYPEVLKTQLRAMLRAVEGKKLRVMFPMIADSAELRQARAILEEAKEELAAKGEVLPSDIAVGIMVEMPSAAVLADHLAEECDFFSIGSNDLIQYCLAIDRANEHLAYLYHPLHPSILRLVRFVVDAAHKNGIRVSLCGAMAGEPAHALVLVGMGIDELSMPPVAIAPVRRAIRQVSYTDAADLAESLLDLKTVQDVDAAVAAFLAEHFPEEFEHRDEDPLLAWRHPRS